MFGDACVSFTFFWVGAFFFMRSIRGVWALPNSHHRGLAEKYRDLIIGSKKGLNPSTAVSCPCLAEHEILDHDVLMLLLSSGA
jgi:hypothetical protein